MAVQEGSKIIKKEELPGIPLSKVEYFSSGMNGTDHKNAFD